MGRKTILVAGVLASWALAAPVDLNRRSLGSNSTLPSNSTAPETAVRAPFPYFQYGAQPGDYANYRDSRYSPSYEDVDEQYTRGHSSRPSYADAGIHEPDRGYSGAGRDDRGYPGSGSFVDTDDDYLPPNRNPAFLQALANGGLRSGAGYRDAPQNVAAVPQVEAPEVPRPVAAAAKPAPPPGVWTQMIAEAPAATEAPAAFEQEAESQAPAAVEALQIPVPAPAPVPAAPRIQAAPKAAPIPAIQHAAPQAAAQPRPAPPAVVIPAAVNSEAVNRKAIWQPAVGAKYQIILSAPIDTGSKSIFSSKKADILPSDAQIFDIDLFDTDADDIKALHAAGKKVICYFSAGTWEKARPDTADFPASIKGSGVKRNDFGAYWDESWLDIRNPNPSSSELPLVWKLMQKRIKLAAEKGCDAIDPDNMDAYDPDNLPIGFPITRSHSVAYLKFMADEAAKYGMGTGLKNALDMIPEVSDFIQFAVNEQCVGSDECSRYHSFLNGQGGRAGKPVFHIEYIDDDSKGPATNSGSRAGNSRNTAMTGRLMDSLCMKNDGSRISMKFSTVIKEMELGGWVQFCDGSQVTTSTKDKGATSSRGNRGGKDSSDSADNEDSSDASESYMSGMSGSSSSASQASSSTASTAGSMLTSLGSGLYGLLTGGYSSSPKSSSASSSSSSWFGSSSAAKPSSYASSSSSSSTSSGSWLSSIFSGYSSSSTSKPAAPAAPAKPAASYSSSSGGFWSGVSSLFGYGSGSGTSAPAAPAKPAAPVAPAASAASASCSSSSSSGLGGFLSGLNPYNWFKKGC